MALTVSKMSRVFQFNGIRLPDPNPNMTVDDVKAFYAAQYPELATAVVNGPEAAGDKMRYTFDRAIEIRGASAFFRRRSLSRFFRLNAGISRTRRRSHFSVELRIWLARICFQNRLSRCAG